MTGSQLHNELSACSQDYVYKSYNGRGCFWCIPHIGTGGDKSPPVNPNVSYKKRKVAAAESDQSGRFHANKADYMFSFQYWTTPLSSRKNPIFICCFKATNGHVPFLQLLLDVHCARISNKTTLADFAAPPRQYSS